MKEETGAENFDLQALFIYGVAKDAIEDFGMVFLAEIETLSCYLESEIEEIFLLTKEPEELTYPLIQPYLFKKAQNMMRIGD